MGYRRNLKEKQKWPDYLGPKTIHFRGMWSQTLGDLNRPGQMEILKFILMKKLSLKKLNLESGEQLHREQLKTIFGGYGGGNPCDTGTTCSSSSDCGSGCSCADHPNGQYQICWDTGY